MGGFQQSANPLPEGEGGADTCNIPVGSVTSTLNRYDSHRDRQQTGYHEQRNVDLIAPCYKAESRDDAAGSGNITAVGN